MRDWRSLRQLQKFSLLAFGLAALPLALSLSPGLAQDGGAGGGSALQGGVSAIDRAQERQTMRLNIGQPAAGFIDNGQFLQGSAHTERVPPAVYRGWLNDNHPRFTLSTGVMSNALVVDVAGRWDHADKTLDKFGINYTHIKTGEIDPQVLAGAKVLVINCAGEVRRDRLQYIRDWVQRGGYLLTTDWALNNMVEQTFPGYISWNKSSNSHSIYTANFTSPDPILAKGCVRSAPWKLDAGAHLIGIQRRDQVRVLVTSPDLAPEDSDRAGVLACVFPFGKGYVLHMLGHFDNNAPIVFGNLLPDPAPNIKISLRQALAANFVVAGLTGEPLSTALSGQQMDQPISQPPGQPPGKSMNPPRFNPPAGAPPGRAPWAVQQQGQPPAHGQSTHTTPAQSQVPYTTPAQSQVPYTPPGEMPPKAPERLKRPSQ